MKRRVLVVDDHIPSRTFLVQALGKCGFEVVGEGIDGKSARDLVKKTFPDVVLMAVRFPDLDGVSAAQGIMERGYYLAGSLLARAARQIG